MTLPGMPLAASQSASISSFLSLTCLTEWSAKVWETGSPRILLPRHLTLHRRGRHRLDRCLQLRRQWLLFHPGQRARDERLFLIRGDDRPGIADDLEPFGVGIEGLDRGLEGLDVLVGRLVGQLL